MGGETKKKKKNIKKIGKRSSRKQEILTNLNILFFFVSISSVFITSLRIFIRITFIFARPIIFSVAIIGIIRT